MAAGGEEQKLGKHLMNGNVGNLLSSVDPGVWWTHKQTPEPVSLLFCWALEGLLFSLPLSVRASSGLNLLKWNQSVAGQPSRKPFDPPLAPEHRRCPLPFPTLPTCSVCPGRFPSPDQKPSYSAETPGPFNAYPKLAGPIGKACSNSSVQKAKRLAAQLYARESPSFLCGAPMGTLPRRKGSLHLQDDSISFASQGTSPKQVAF